MKPPATLELETPPADQTPKTPRTERTVHVTYSPTEWALLQARFPMTEEDWDAMIAVLGAMKRGLVQPKRAASIKVGDIVNWESQGVIHGERLTVRRIEAGPDGATYAFVEGSDSGIPVGQLTPAT